MSTITGAESLADRLRDLGDIPLDRVRAHPPMGTATFDDLVTANSDRSKALCELVDQTLVEKAMGYEASIVAITIARILSLYVSRQKLGLISGADGFFPRSPKWSRSTRTACWPKVVSWLRSLTISPSRSH